MVASILRLFISNLMKIRHLVLRFLEGQVNGLKLAFSTKVRKVG
jgi:hypothetical protein